MRGVWGQSKLNALWVLGRLAGTGRTKERKGKGCGVKGGQSPGGKCCTTKFGGGWGSP